jgi:hypothetical protein
MERKDHVVVADTSSGTIMAQNGGLGTPANRNRWYRLTPDLSGSYVNGTWPNLASMSRQRLYYASNVLPGGRVFVLGGDYSGRSRRRGTGKAASLF